MQPAWKPVKRPNPCAFGTVSVVSPRCHLPQIPVAYPAGFNNDAMVCSLCWSGGPLLGTPARMGYRPVSKAAREGAQTGAAAYQLVKREPEAASKSILDVFRSVAPHAPISWQPRSSARKMTKFGLCAGLRFCAIAPPDAADERNCLRENISNMLSQGYQTFLAACGVPSWAEWISGR